MIYKYPDKHLKAMCKRVVDFNDNKVKYVIDKLMLEYNSRKCQGLASTQIGLDLSIAVVRLYKKAKPVIIINPEVVKTFLHRNSLEHCESSDGWFNVKRPILAHIKFETIDGQVVDRWFKYKQARVICHEIDHLKGLCLNDTGELSVYSKYYDKIMGY